SEKMRKFIDRQRVVIVHPERWDGLRGRTGTVLRLCRGDDAAWIEIDDEIPDGVRVFPHDDDRLNHMLFYPQECSPE
ncbi:hypothetical protein, partial [Thiolapillus sp.]